jgi:glycerophosphoryl diester phosphodiesterase
VVSSFSPATLHDFRRRSRGRARTGAHPVEVVAYLLVPSARLARLLTPGRPVAIQVPHRRGPLRVASRGLIRRAHDNGLQVHVWTIDDPDEMRELLDRGVDGLMTDRTDLLKDVLVERGQWGDQR